MSGEPSEVVKGEVPKESKLLWKSRTFWLNVAALVVGVSAVVVDTATGFEGEFWDNVVKIAMFVAAVGNVFLRLDTKVPAKLTE